MIKTGKIERLIELCLLSGYVKDDEAPISIILIANAESGKTKMIQQFKCKHTIETSDLSSQMVKEYIIPLLENNKLHHIIIPDFIKVMAHKEATVKATIAFLNALIEEGVKNQLFHGQSFFLREIRKCGLLTSMTTDYFYKMFRYFHAIGFDTRILPISFIYSNETVMEIHKGIQNELLNDNITKMKHIGKKNIKIPEEFGDALNTQVLMITGNQKKDSIRVRGKGGLLMRIPIEFYGFRLHKQLRKLLKTIALSHNKTIVDSHDVNELFGLLDYIRLPKNPKVI